MKPWRWRMRLGSILSGPRDSRLPTWRMKDSFNRPRQNFCGSRRHIGAERVQVWTDVKKKHSSHAITADVDIGETAHAVEFMRGDAVIVTGTVTGEAPQGGDLLAVKRKTQLPVYLSFLRGDGGESAEFFRGCRWFYCGAEFKRNGQWAQAVEAKRVDRLHGGAR